MKYISIILLVLFCGCTHQQKQIKTLNILDFGADSSGKVNSYEAIHRAVDSAWIMSRDTTVILYFPKGNYLTFSVGIDSFGVQESTDDKKLIRDSPVWFKDTLDADGNEWRTTKDMSQQQFIPNQRAAQHNDSSDKYITIW